MHPVLATLSFSGRTVTVGSYGVMMVLAVVSAFCLTLRLSRRSPFTWDDVLTYLLIVMAGGVAGAYICGLLMSLPDLARNGFSHYSPLLVSWGGIAGGVIAALCIDAYWKIGLAAFADLIAPAYLLGIGIGRIGCFLGGCCYGIHTSSCVGVRFTDPIGLASYAAQPLVPIQLVSSAGLLLCSAVFAALYMKRVLTGGRLFAASAMTYGVLRFTVEFWRDDPRLFLFGLSDGQLFSAAFFTAGALILLRAERST